MKKIIVILLIVLGSVGLKAQEINWLTLNEALELQKKTPKKIIMDVYTNWCGPCKLLDKKTFHNKDVVEYINKNYYAVKFNAEGNQKINFNGKEFGNPDYKASLANRRNSMHQFSLFMGINSFPTLVFFNNSGNFIAPIPGYQTPQQLEFFLKMFVSDDYKNIKTQEDFKKYQKAFKAEFKE